MIYIFLTFAGYLKIIQILWQKNAGLALLLILLGLIPLLIPVFAVLFSKNKQKDAWKKFQKDVLYVAYIIGKISVFLWFMFALRDLIQNEKNIDAELRLCQLFQYSAPLFIIVYINYFSTRNIKFKRNIKNFLRAIEQFFKETFLLNIFVFLFLAMIKNNHELMLGVLCSYIFFFVTEINSIYRKNSKNEEYESVDMILQIALNFSLIYYLESLEMIFIHLIKEKSMDLNSFHIPAVIILYFIIIIMQVYPSCYPFLKRNIIKKLPKKLGLFLKEISNEFRQLAKSFSFKDKD